ncbi:hypothetical protein HNQ41_002124 [Texcoconibacillus texcoconensis]|uniref:Uncharacterized protein n=1 Tax=Texcoconibacillus texcoconensis TaxID=1095777 RepID=A0A840QRD8_9BACI|nr:hypothetical protein [Texcoconibacillus texcoconensis]
MKSKEFIVEEEKSILVRFSCAFSVGDLRG